MAKHSVSVQPNRLTGWGGGVEEGWVVDGLETLLSLTLRFSHFI